MFIKLDRSQAEYAYDYVRMDSHQQNHSVKIAHRLISWTIHAIPNMAYEAEFLGRDNTYEELYLLAVLLHNATRYTHLRNTDSYSAMCATIRELTELYERRWRCPNHGA